MDRSECFSSVVGKALMIFAIQAPFTILQCPDCYAIFTPSSPPQSRAQIQATEDDFSKGISNEIGSVLDTKTRGATATQSLAPRNSVLNASATTEVPQAGEHLKLRASISQSTSSDSVPSDPLGATASYTVSAAAEFRDIIHISSSRGLLGATAHLVFRLEGGPLTATAANPGSVAAMSGEVRLSINLVRKFGETGSTSSTLGKFNGTADSFDVEFPVEVVSGSKEARKVQLDALLYLSGAVSTFYAASNGADYLSGYRGLILDAAYVTDYDGSRVDDVYMFGDSGYVYAGSPPNLMGRYSGKNKAAGITFSGDIDCPTSNDPGCATVDPYELLLLFKMQLGNAKFSGLATLPSVTSFSGVGPITFGKNHASSLQLKQKKKQVGVLTLSMKKSGNSYQIVGKVKRKAGSTQFIAKRIK